MPSEAIPFRQARSCATLLFALTLFACAPGGEPHMDASAPVPAASQGKLGANQDAAPAAAPTPVDTIAFDCLLDPASGDTQSLEVVSAQFVSPSPHTLALYVEPALAVAPVLDPSQFPLTLTQIGTELSWSGQYIAVAIDKTTPRAPQGYEGTVGVFENGVLTPRTARCDLQWLTR
jgi:hypothetical protein